LRVYGGLKSQDVELFCKILAFLWKNDPSRGNFQNSVPTQFIAIPIDVLLANFVEFDRREIGEVVRYLPDKKQQQNFASLFGCRY